MRRFIDPESADPIAEAPKYTNDALSLDFDGATFTHTDGRVTLKVLAAVRPGA